MTAIFRDTSVAWPILKKFGYPFTMFIYTDYVKGGPKSGGQSISWEQLAEMRDAGVDIQSHTVSHSSLNAKKGKTDEQYQAWLKSELAGSKELLEKNLGIQVKAIAYPYGLHSEPSARPSSRRVTRPPLPCTASASDMGPIRR